MSGTVVKLKDKPSALEVITITPAMAAEMLEKNTYNRPISDQHVDRIARQIKAGKWRFNGDTIKISITEDVMDGQHRLWGCFKADMSIETVIVRGIEKEAFSTIDTIRKSRSGADVIALMGEKRYGRYSAAALAWMLRWQRGVIEKYKVPANKIENSDIEEMFAMHPGIMRAVERCLILKGLGQTAIVIFLYYVIAAKEPELADRMVNTLHDPTGVGMNDPFFRLSSYFRLTGGKSREPVMTIALCIKAINAAHAKRPMQGLAWRSQGKSPEPFPKLEVK